MKYIAYYIHLTLSQNNYRIIYMYMELSWVQIYGHEILSKLNSRIWNINVKAPLTEVLFKILGYLPYFRRREKEGVSCGRNTFSAGGGWFAAAASGKKYGSSKLLCKMLYVI